METKRVVVLVEDHPAQREAIKRCLVEKNFHVVPFSDYHAAIKALENARFRIFSASTWQRCQGESGLELCEFARKNSRLRFVPILMISDRSSPEDMTNT